MRNGRGLAPLADIPDCQRRDGPPELVIACEYSVIPMPVLPRRRHEIGEPVHKLKRRELDDAIGPRPRKLLAAAGPDPVGGFVPAKHVEDTGYAAVFAADHGEPLQRGGRPPAKSQEMLQALKVARHVPIDEHDSHVHIDGNPLFSQASMSAAVAASSRRVSLDQRITRRRTRSVRGQVGIGDRLRRQERRRSVPPGAAAAGRKTPSVTHACRCTW